MNKFTDAEFAALKRIAQKEVRRFSKEHRKNNPPSFFRPMKLSWTLRKAINIKEESLPRTFVVKKLWNYIKTNNLLDSKNRRNINCDENLQQVFGGKKVVSMFEMTKLVSKHLT